MALRRTVARKTEALKGAFGGRVDGMAWVQNSNGKGKVQARIKEDHGTVLLFCAKCNEWKHGLLFVMSRWSSGKLCNRCKECRSRKNTARTMLDKVDAKLNTSYKKARAREKYKLQRGLTELHKVYARHRLRHREYAERVQYAHDTGRVVEDKLWQAFQYQRSKLVEEIDIEKWLRSEASLDRYPTLEEAREEVLNEGKQAIERGES